MPRSDTKFTDYLGKVNSDAESIINKNWEMVKTNAINGNYYKNKYPMNDLEIYIYEYLDQEINLFEAADILSQCIYQEGDYGLWEGCINPEEAVGIKAFYSFLNDVNQEIQTQLLSKLENLQVEYEIKLNDVLNQELNKAISHISKMERQKETLQSFGGYDYDDKIDDLSGYIQETYDTISSIEDRITQQEDIIRNIENTIRYLY